MNEGLRREQMRIGFIGLGVMGAPMALNLLKAGHTLTVHRVRERHQGLLEAGAVAADSPQEVAEKSQVIVLMLPDTPDVEKAVIGADGVLSGLQEGSLVIDMSSISPVVTKDVAASVRRAGGEYIDAPVSGGEAGAREGALTIFLGGSEAVVEEAMPLFQTLGKNITHMGEVGAGQATKVVNQIIVGLTIEAVAEGLSVAEASGIDAGKAREALSGGFASSRILEMHGQRMVNRTFDPGFRIRLHRKDLGLALAAAEHHGVELPGIEVVARQMDKALAKDWGELDHAALFRLIAERDV
ncbi:NAD(P)-dependent oxidoreductase [Nesterenkonia xinjiangensis]